MTRFLLVLAFGVLPGLVGANRPFHIRGKVYCDTCRAGFETSSTTYIHDAKVKIECKDRKSLELKYSIGGLTDSTGTYNIKVETDHKDEMCYVSLVSSPVHDCKSADPGRSHAEIILTRSNGVISDLHFANAMGFLKDKPLAGCSQLLKHYLVDGDRSIF